jgi:hypothetical protein
MMELRYDESLTDNSSMADGKLDHGQVGGTNVKGCENLNVEAIKLVSCEMVLGQTSANVGGKEGPTKLEVLECGEVGTYMYTKSYPL